jgi:predicted nucleic acid-binding protein
VQPYLADTSAWYWSRRAADRWDAFFEAGLVVTCAPVQLELLYSARSAREFANLSQELARLPYFELDERASDAALQAQGQLALRGEHRLPAVDFLVAALAEVNDAIVLHYDRHFDTIGRVTKQPMEWIARRGSLD